MGKKRLERDPHRSTISIAEGEKIMNLYTYIHATFFLIVLCLIRHRKNCNFIFFSCYKLSYLACSYSELIS